MKTFDAVVVGAGQAGLGMSYYLQRDHRHHVLFERGRIGESWLSQRWESFRLNTPNLMNALPGSTYEGSEPHSFCKSIDLVEYFHRYVQGFQLPVQTGTSVTSVNRAENGRDFILETATAGQVGEPVLSRTIVIASGAQNKPKFPSVRSRLPPGITQLHTAEYRSPSALPAGAVVVVGSAQSGCQVAEDLISAGRVVYLCTSKVGRVPRRYRGRDLLEWWAVMKHLDVTLSSLEDKSISLAPQPHISGLGPLGHTLSLQGLARQGVVVLGRLVDVEAGTLILSDDAVSNVRYADEFSQRAKEGIDAYIQKTGITVPPAETDPADVPDPVGACVSRLQRLDLHLASVSTVIWATGFAPDFSYIHLPITDAQGSLLHQRGVSSQRGLYFIGLPWLNSRKSGIIYGIDEDARFIAAEISSRLT